MQHRGLPLADFAVGDHPRLLAMTRPLDFNAVHSHVSRRPAASAAEA